MSNSRVRTSLLLGLPLCLGLVVGTAHSAPKEKSKAPAEKPAPAESAMPAADKAKSPASALPSDAEIEMALARRARFTRGQFRDVDMIDMALRAAAPRRSNADLIKEALSHRNVRYRWGGASRSGFDCSGLTLYVIKKKRGVSLPHSARAQARLGVKVARKNLQPGDLVFFRTYRRSISHVGIYIGQNKFVHASGRGRGVRVDTLTGYYDKRFVTARRYPQSSAAKGTKK